MGFEFEFRRKEEGEFLSLPAKDDDTCQCRICHEEEPASSTSMESPCTCSGSLKFAHRKCVQRWCDEKGSTVCEICLQNFEPDYRAPPTPKKLQSADVAVTIRGSLEIRRQTHAAIDVTNLNVECTSPHARNRPNAASCCRSLAITFTALLIMRHLMDVVLDGAADQDACSLFIMFSLRATGILLPSFVLLRLISAIQHGQRQYQLEQIQLRRGEERIALSASGEENPRHYTIQILS